MKQEPGVFTIGQKCSVGGYNWSDNRIHCWRLNWHVPIWKQGLRIDDMFINSFRKGILGYSFVEIKGPCNLPVFIFRFHPPIDYWHGVANARLIHPERLFDVKEKANRDMILLLIKNNRVIDTINVLIDEPIMGKYYESISRQAASVYSIADFNKANKTFTQNLKIKELYMAGQKGSCRVITNNGGNNVL